MSVAERMSFNERLDHAAKVIMNPSLILMWSFSDPIHPQVIGCPLEYILDISGIVIIVKRLPLPVFFSGIDSACCKHIDQFVWSF